MRNCLFSTQQFHAYIQYCAKVLGTPFISFYIKSHAYLTEMEPVTMTFLRVMEQNDICNLLLKNMDIANQKFSYNRNGDILLF